ncbi:MAG TPA: hypothetical protein VHO70_15255 [Chitinispirillaceae bacterium]|nr:hypothetical protein [Chitinispirillaceae bacterium]
MIKNPYLDYLFLIDSLKKYASPKARLTSMIKSGEVIKVKRGLYVDSKQGTYSLKTVANKIFGPSYISFEYALSYYNLIPERVDTISSASIGKNKTRIYQTPLGTFLYKSINPQVYPYGILRIEEDTGPFLIATREKALCDTLSKVSTVMNLSSLENLLFEDLRIERDELRACSLQDFEMLIPQYQKKNLRLFLKFLNRELHVA